MRLLGQRAKDRRQVVADRLELSRLLAGGYRQSVRQRSRSDLDIKRETRTLDELVGRRSHVLGRRRSGRHMREERPGRGGFVRELDRASSLSSYGRAVEVARWWRSCGQRLIWSAQGGISHVT